MSMLDVNRQRNSCPQNVSSEDALSLGGGGGRYNADYKKLSLMPVGPQDNCHPLLSYYVSFVIVIPMPIAYGLVILFPCSLFIATHMKAKNVRVGLLKFGLETNVWSTKC